MHLRDKFSCAIQANTHTQSLTHTHTHTQSVIELQQTTSIPTSIAYMLHYVCLMNFALLLSMFLFGFIFAFVISSFFFSFAACLSHNIKTYLDRCFSIAVMSAEFRFATSFIIQYWTFMLFILYGIGFYYCNFLVDLFMYIETSHRSKENRRNKQRAEHRRKKQVEESKC